MKVLVTGGAGFIGSHMVRQLCKNSVSVVVLDDLSSGSIEAVSVEAELVIGSVADVNLLTRLFAIHKFDAVIHFASSLQVEQSVIDPSAYYLNNVAASLVLLAAMRDANIQHFVFSSTAAVYGRPIYLPMDEMHPKNPVNPYGRGKWMVEQVLRDFDDAYGLKSVCLRYFNASGVDIDAKVGSSHLRQETHLIPLVLQAASGRRATISIYGDDYLTPDGTCIRDYVHVADICEAIKLALEHLWDGGNSRCFNLGSEIGSSVKEVIECAQIISGRQIRVVYEARRAGDPARLVAGSQMARTDLGWKPTRSDLASIISDVWKWEQKY